MATSLHHFDFVSAGELAAGVQLLADKYQVLLAEQEQARARERREEEGVEELLDEGPVRALRWDSESRRWRARGEGRVSVVYYVGKGLAKLVFVDEAKAKGTGQVVRLLQWVDGSSKCEVKGDVVEWEGADHTMYERLKIVMVGRWRLYFVGQPDKARLFGTVWNERVAALVKTHVDENVDGNAGNDPLDILAL